MKETESKEGKKRSGDGPILVREKSRETRVF